MRKTLIAAVILAACGAASAEFPQPENVAELRAFREIDDAALARLRERGLVVLSDSAGGNLHDCYLQLEGSGLPLYLTCDAVLYAWAKSLKRWVGWGHGQLKREWLTPFLDGMMDQCRELDPAGEDAAVRANLVTLAAARALLDEEWTPPRAIALEVAAAMAPTPDDPRAKGSRRPYWISQDRLRDREALAFWEAQGIVVGGETTDGDLRRAALLALAMRDGEGLAEVYGNTLALREFLNGETDALLLDEMLEVCDAAWGEGWDAAALEDLAPLRRELSADRYAGRKLSLLGERRWPDVDVSTGLMIAAAAGSERAAQRLAELPAEQAPTESLYASWLQVARTLFERPDGLPPFASGEAFQDKQINCCVTSWAQFTRSYSAQSSSPHKQRLRGDGLGFVEPLPAVFRGCANTLREVRLRLGELAPVPDYVSSSDTLADKAEIYARCAEDQLAGRDTSWALEDVRGFGRWLKEIGFESHSSTELSDNPVFAPSNQPGAALEVVTGPLHQIVVMVERDGHWLGGVGYVTGYQERKPPPGQSSRWSWRPELEDRGALTVRPDWLADLYAPAEQWQREAGERLRRMEDMLRRELVDDAAEELEGIVAEYPGTAAPPAAALLLGRHLADAERYDEAVAALGPAGQMFGCAARFEALRLERKCAEELTKLAFVEEKRGQLSQALAATDPREGLTDEQEVDRQNQRALLLIERGGADGIERLRAECPRSGYLPYGELRLLLSGDSEYQRGWARPYLRADQRRTKLLALAEKYPGSAIARGALAAAAGVLQMVKDYEAAYAEALLALEMKLPDPDPWLLSAESYEREKHRLVVPTPERVVATAGYKLLSHALGTGDLETALALTPTVSPLRSELHNGLYRALDYLVWFADEPEALRGLGQADDYLMDHEQFPWPETLERIRRAEAVADAHPGTRVARAALMSAPSPSRDERDNAELVAAYDRVVRRLAREYPGSIEAEVTQQRLLARSGETEKARTISDRLQAEYGKRGSRELQGTYIGHVLDRLSRAEALPGSRARQTEGEIKRQWEEYGDLLTVAGLDQEWLREQVETRKVRALPGVLVERLPDRELEVIDRAVGTSYYHSELVDEVLARHPDDPLALRIRLRGRGYENVLRVIAASSGTEVFAEAVDQQEQLAQCAFASYTDDLATLYQTLNLTRAAAARYADTPAQAPALGAVVTSYLNWGQPERALDYAEMSLALVEEGRPARDRLEKIAAGARGQVEARRVSLEAVWTLSIVCSGDEYFPCRITLTGDRLYLAVPTEQGVEGLMCLDAAGGEALWHVATGEVVSLAPEDGRVFVGTGRGSVVCLDAADGAERWRANLGPGQAGSVHLDVGEGVVAADWDQGLVCVLDAETGALIWQRDAFSAEVAPTVWGDRVCYWQQRGDLTMRDLATGDKLWSFDWRALADEGSGIRSPRALYVQPLVTEEYVVGGGPVKDGGKLAAWDARTGELLWTLPMHLPDRDPARLFATEDGRVVLTGAGGLTAYDPANGSVAWRITSGWWWSAWTGSGRELLIGRDREGCRVVDPKLGEVVARLPGVDGQRGVVGEVIEGELRLWAVGKRQVTGWRMRLPAALVERGEDVEQ